MKLCSCYAYIPWIYERVSQHFRDLSFVMSHASVSSDTWIPMWCLANVILSFICLWNGVNIVYSRLCIVKNIFGACWWGSWERRTSRTLRKSQPYVWACGNNLRNFDRNGILGIKRNNLGIIKDNIWIMKVFYKL